MPPKHFRASTCAWAICCGDIFSSSILNDGLPLPPSPVFAKLSHKFLEPASPATVQESLRLSRHLTLSQA
jgi:hypothetical protein